MSFPEPVPGLVIRYAFLWRDAALRGEEEGRKDRPCAIVVTSFTAAGERVVVALPITHSPPLRADLAVEIPMETKVRLGLDVERSWIVVTDANRFVWPGPDLRPRVPGAPETVAYGILPRALFRELRDKLAHAIAGAHVRIVRRTD
ncbi:growth inhibitor PemK [Phenylobacterium sp.]|uniref:growth inhibitor PemK n=1 Tax=Phenylobacterium sp. TaxID=1871053 RepID=UPI0025F30D70|nr:growth inhibitor PemK [Phenylobacterium sp.]MBX3483271.1 growth inhibitor PemK [Phenylobacterium sp.]MCW5759479.1 growth inhibitor PemK [Phenylobacterium sp.]